MARRTTPSDRRRWQSGGQRARRMVRRRYRRQRREVRLGRRQFPLQRQPIELAQGGREMEGDPVVAEPAFLVLAGDGVRPGRIATVQTGLIILDQRD